MTNYITITHTKDDEKPKCVNCDHLSDNDNNLYCINCLPFWYNYKRTEYVDIDKEK